MAERSVDWGLAQRVAIRAAGTEPYRLVHYDSMLPDFTELTAIAERRWRSPRAAQPGRSRRAGSPTGRLVEANIASFQRLLRRSPTLEERFGADGPVASRIAGIRGHLLGWVHPGARQYDAGDRGREPRGPGPVYSVGPNVLSLEKRFAFPPREFRLWLALTRSPRAQFTGIPWMREHFLGLVAASVSAVDADPKAFIDALAGGRVDGRGRTRSTTVVSWRFSLARAARRARADQWPHEPARRHGDVTMTGPAPIRSRTPSGSGGPAPAPSAAQPATKFLQSSSARSQNEAVDRASAHQVVEERRDRAARRAWEAPEFLPVLSGSATRSLDRRIRETAPSPRNARSPIADDQA